jgi:hypothetical protein
MDCFATLAMTWMGRSVLLGRIREHDNLERTPSPLLQIENAPAPHVAALLSK